MLVMGLIAIMAAIASPFAYRRWRERQLQARRERRYRRIGFQRAWNWLMRPRVPRLTDQRESVE